MDLINIKRSFNLELLIYLFLLVMLISCTGSNNINPKDMTDNKYGFAFKPKSISSIVDNNTVIFEEVLRDNPHYFGYIFSDLAMYTLENPSANINLSEIYRKLIACYKANYSQDIKGDSIVNMLEDHWWRDMFARDAVHML